MIELCTVGGFSEVGRNMTALKIDNEVVILDMGFYLQKIVDFEEEGGERRNLTADGLIHINAIPNDKVITPWASKVKAIACSHCHLDHIGAVPYLAPRYKGAPIIGTPYTIEVLNRMMKDDKIRINNQTKAIHPNSSFKVSKNIEIELINMTHSTLQTALIAVHTRYGTILYANDFKFDNHPVLGKKPNYERLKQLGKGNVIALIVDSIYSNAEMKTPSEKVAREMLKDVLLGTENQNHSIIVTCFASHMARLKSIIDFGKKLDRKILFLGRSLAKYTASAENLDLVDYSRKVEIVAYGAKIKRKLKEIEKRRSDYLIVATGGQAEPNAVLTRMMDKRLPFKFNPEDHVIFSNKVIPVEPNIRNRKNMERGLRSKKIRIFTDIHASGHCAREDLRDLINMVKPRYVIPAHGDITKRQPLAELATEMGYKPNKEILLMKNGEKKVLN